MSRLTIGVVGAGFTGATIARVLAEAGHRVTVHDRRDHVAGNCHTARHPETGILEHVYGPHVFHTSNEAVWQFVTRFGEFLPYRLRVMAAARSGIYALPINLHTLNQFFGLKMDPATASEFVRGLGLRDTPPGTSLDNLEDYAISIMGRALYEEFFEGYTRKQWGRDPRELPASVLRRLPFRFDYNVDYFDHRYQAIPRHGYTAIVEEMLTHPRIDVATKTVASPEIADEFDHLFWTGPLDAFFSHDQGALEYRTLDFHRSVHDGDYQGCSVMNETDPDVAHTRTTEHKHFTPWERHQATLVTTEFSRTCTAHDEPYYPVRLTGDMSTLKCYVDAARHTSKVTFAGRLGTYRYLDMDQAIGEALALAAASQECFDRGVSPPVFHVDIGGRPSR